MLAFSLVSPKVFTPRSTFIHSTSVICKRTKSYHFRNPSSISMSLDPHSAIHISQTAHTAVTHLLSHIDPANISPHNLNSISNLLADATAAISSAADTAANVAGDAAATAGQATEAVAKQSGVWAKFVHTIESAIVLIHSGLTKVGIPGAYGLSIVFFTLIVKAITFPLNYRQMESTMKMQAISPKLKKIQSDYKDNPAVMQQMTADLYKKQNVNPLAGCFPVFVQIPIWVALYRSVLNLASENKLNESFLWLPSLQGPVTTTGQGLDTWLFPLVNGQPPIGWHDALCYLTLPIILMINQYYTTKLITPPSNDPQSQQANNFLKFMPLLIGFFSLNVPSGLGVYWVTNNFLSTAQTLFIRSRFPKGSFNINDGEDEDDSVIDVKATADGFTSNSASTPSSTSPKAIKGSKNKKRRKRR